MASKFIEDIRRHMRMRGYSLKTEKAYIYWIKYFIRFNKLKHPQDMGTTEVTAYLSYLANEQHVAINTQKVALDAIAFLYNQFLQRPLGDLGFTYAKKQRKVPSVLTPNEVQLILSHLSGVNHSIFSLLYGSGLRVNECLRIRVQDLDLQNLSLTVRDGKGMSLTTEAFLISLPIAVFLQGVVLAVGFVIWGENFHVPSTNIIGVCLGLIAYFQVKKHLERKQSN